MAACTGTQVNMNSFLIPLLAIRVHGHELLVLAIIVPLGLAYVILLWQVHNPACDYRKESAITCDDLRQEGVDLSHAEENTVHGMPLEQTAHVSKFIVLNSGMKTYSRCRRCSRSLSSGNCQSFSDGYCFECKKTLRAQELVEKERQK